MHDVGAKVHLLKGLKLHGKIVIADGKQAIVGSINLSPGSFDSRRELAIETKSKRVLKRLVQVSRRDWKHSRRIDLSDEGILADLEKHGSKDANLLALGPVKPRKARLRGTGCTDVRSEFSSIHKTGQIRFFPKAAVPLSERHVH